VCSKTVERIERLADDGRLCVALGDEVLAITFPRGDELLALLATA